LLQNAVCGLLCAIVKVDRLRRIQYNPEQICKSWPI